MKNEASSFLKIVIKYNDIFYKTLFAEATLNDDVNEKSMLWVHQSNRIQIFQVSQHNNNIILKKTGSTLTWKIVAVNKVMSGAYNRKNYAISATRLVWQRSGYKSTRILQ